MYFEKYDNVILFNFEEKGILRLANVYLARYPIKPAGQPLKATFPLSPLVFYLLE